MQFLRFVFNSSSDGSSIYYEWLSTSASRIILVCRHMKLANMCSIISATRFAYEF